MNTPSQLRFGFWSQWILLNAAGWAMGMTLRQLLFGISGFATNPVLIGLVIGAVIGILQLFALAQSGPQAGLWVLAHMAGWAAGWGAGWGLGWELLGAQGFKGAFGTVGAVGGAVAGAIQWLILRQQVYQAGWWVLASPLGWAIGLATGVSIGGAFGWAAAGALSGVVTGLALLWLLQHPVSADA